MDDGVGIAEALAKRRIERDAANLRATHRVHQPQPVHIDGHLARFIPHAEIVEGMEGVRPELDTGTDLAQHRRLLEHGDRAAFLGEAEGCGEATDPTARNQDGLAHDLQSFNRRWRSAASIRAAPRRAPPAGRARVVGPARG